MRLVRRRDETISLTQTEFDLLQMFITNPRQALSRENLIESVWGFDDEGSSNTLDVYISRLRRKLGNPPLIHTLYGVGYILRES